MVVTASLFVVRCGGSLKQVVFISNKPIWVGPVGPGLGLQSWSGYFGLGMAVCGGAGSPIFHLKGRAWVQMAWQLILIQPIFDRFIFAP